MRPFIIKKVWASPMTRTLLAAGAALLLAGCGGGGSSTPAALPVSVPTAAPTLAPGASPAPSATPTHAATASPSPSPTATPTIAAALKVIGGAPLTATAAQLSTARRNGQAHTLAQGVTNGLPILVESSGMIAAYAGTQVTWVTNAQTTKDIPETAGTVTASGNLPINNPGFTPLSCLGQVSAVCIVHPMGWDWGTSSVNGKPIGKSTLTVAFGDGTTGTTFDYVFDGWDLPCNTGWAYVNGVPVAQAAKATSDVYADCLNGNIDFPMGGLVLSQPSSDQYGNYATIFPTFTAAPVIAALNGVVSMASISQGIVFAIQTQDGGTAKVYFTSAGIPGIPTGIAADGMALHSSANGTYAF